MEDRQNKNQGSIQLEETEIIHRILGGEKALYELLIRRNNQKLYRAVRGYFKDETEIEDIMQNSYLKAYTKLNQFKFKATFSTWLIRIGINEALARLKENQKLTHLNHNIINITSYKTQDIPDKNQLNPQEKMIRTEARQLIENAIDTLDLKYRTVYILKEIEGLSLNEIAVVQDITLSNAKVRLHRAKQNLKERLYELSTDGNIFEFGFNKCDRVTENIMKIIQS